MDSTGEKLSADGEPSTDSSSSLPRGPRFTMPVDPARLRAGVPIIATRFRDSDHFLRSVDPGAGPAGEVSLHTRASHTRGREVVLEVRWPALPNRVYLRAEARKTTWTGRRVFRLLDGERSKMRFMIRMATGRGPAPAIRVHRRYCVRLPVEWRPFGAREMMTGMAEDISVGGVRIVGAFFPIAVRDQVVVRMRAESAAQDLILTGVVRHVNLPSEHEMALGIMFQHRSSGEQRSLRRLLHVFAAKGVVILDPM